MKSPFLNTALLCSAAIASLFPVISVRAADQSTTKQTDKEEVAAEHAAAGIDVKQLPIPGDQRTQHPEAQWFPDAVLGLFLHWDPASNFRPNSK
jgi:alpha-L-fucosidase